jgi:putative ABC transport system permease protein
MPWHERWRNVFRQQQLDDKLDAELAYHLAETVDRLMERHGLTEREAYLEARKRLGNYGLHKEKTRDMNIAGWLDSARADLLYGLRQLRTNPGFTSVAVLSLALGIGANTAMFQLVNAVQLRTLPVERPQELVTVGFAQGSTRGGWWSSRSANFTSAQWNQIRSQQQAFQGIFAYSAGRFNLTPGGEPRFAEGMFVSGDFFSVLGVRAMLGRTITAADDTPACNTGGAVLSHSFWQREFGGDPNVLGKTVLLSNQTLPVIGVTPPSFYGIEIGNRYDLAIPMCTDSIFAADKKGRAPLPSAWWLSIMGRLKPEYTVERATAHMQALSPAIMRSTLPPDYKPEFANRFLANKLEAIHASTGVSSLRRRYEDPLWLLMAITGLVLLIACANLANLLLARATVRTSEIAVRLAIGASRFRLIQQLLAESLILALAGALLGMGLAAFLSQGLVRFIGTSDDPIFVNTAFDWRVLVFTGALSITTCILFGLLPALRATHLPPVAAMRAGGRSVTADRERFGTRRALVMLQVALSLVLLVGALLFTRSLHNLMTTDAGFQSENLLAVNIDLTKANYEKERRPAIIRELTDQLASLPGVISAAQTGATPLSRSTWDSTIGPDNAPAANSGKSSFFERVSPGYFRTMGTRLLAGRDFESHDTATSTKVAIVNETFAKKYFPNVNPVGHTFHLEAPAGKPETSFQIVGMVGNMKILELREEFQPMAYFPIEQNPDPGTDSTFVLRIAGAPDSIRRGAKQIVADMNSAISIDFRPLSLQVAESLMRERLMATLSGGFGLLAGLLATLGLYGVVAYMVARRQNEIGIRLALGANRMNIVQLVLREAFLLVAAGLAAGVVIALWLGKWVSTLLYGLQPNDVTSLSAACGLLAVIALIASCLPARRAATLDPVETLRNQ